MKVYREKVFKVGIRMFFVERRPGDRQEDQRAGPSCNLGLPVR